MSRYCHVPGCRNGLGKCLTTAPSEPVSYHTLPKGEPQRTRWLNAVRLRASHKDTSSLRVCSDHFLPEDFYYDPKISSELKFKLKKRNLNRDAVPSIFPAAIVRPPQRPRDRARRQEQRCGRASQPEQDAVPMPGKTAAVSSRSIAVQAFPDLRSIGTQANLPKHVKSKSVKVCMDAPPHLPSTPLLPSPEVSPVQHATCQTGSKCGDLNRLQDDVRLLLCSFPNYPKMGDECRVFQTARNSSYQEESVLTLDDSFEGGIQRQSSRPRTEHWTVQGAIEAALCQLRPLNSEPTLVLASRTDTGVHAVESAAHVDLRPANPVLQFQPEHLATSLNTILGRHKHDILIRDVLQVPEWFHARHLARWRSYRYRLAVLKPTTFRGQRITSLRQWLPLSELNRCHIVPPLDVDRAHEAMELLSGEHDFRSFKNVGRTPEEDERETVRNVSEFRLKPAAPLDSDDPLYENLDLWEFHIRARSFLYRQVRRMVTTVLHVALSQPGDPDPLELVRHLLENPSKESWPGGLRVAPACGLYLTRVHYDAAHLDVTAEMPEEVAEMYRARDEKRLQELDSSDDDDDEDEAAASQGAAASACT